MFRAMRNPNVFRLAALAAAALALGACGSSNKEISAAKSAHYKGDKAAMFDAMKTATESTYKLKSADPNALGLETLPRWYSPDGMLASERGGDIRDVPDNSIQLSLRATLLPDGDSWVVQVKPMMLRYHAGSPEPEPLPENDLSVPGWAHEKVDALASDIHKALAQYEVQSVPQTVPAGTTTTAPAAGSAAPAAPGAGSAAPAAPGAGSAAPATPAQAPVKA